MAGVFCCMAIQPYRPVRVDQEHRFKAFMDWASSTASSQASDEQTSVSDAPYAIQIVRQINYGPQESIRYFIPSRPNYVEATEDELVQANFEKLNSYKNFKCAKHDKFFEVNMYQKNAINTHHWRANIARPSRDIDLAFRQKKVEPELGSETERIQDPPPPTSQPKTLLPTSYSPPMQAHEEVAEGKHRETRLFDSSGQPANWPDIEALKRVLRFLLPATRTDLGSAPVLCLLALDWINEELALGLEFETHWDAELTSTNITIFLCDCCDMSVSDIGLADFEDVVTEARSQVDIIGGPQIPGRTRLQRIVDHILDFDPAVDWVCAHRADIARILASGPDEELLERCRRRSGKLPEDESSFTVERALRREFHMDQEEIGSFNSDDRWTYDFDDGGPLYRYDEDDESERMKDFTACDKECGYCGRCDY
ncbi:hypothetical protein GGR54DRAFT_638370 [Hypoxylon sp. NC1633]|nr:hypothetical protein GGR54DRAFT_638370 [Hypoxylon sp. NC1633]